MGPDNVTPPPSASPVSQGSAGPLPTSPLTPPPPVAQKEFPAYLITILIGMGVVAFGAYFVAGGAPLKLLLGLGEPEAEEYVAEGLGADLYEEMSAGASADTVAGLPDTNPLSEAAPDPFAGYSNPFE